MRKAWIIAYTNKVSYTSWHNDGGLGIPQYKIVNADNIFEAIRTSGIIPKYIVSIGWAMVAI